MPSSYNARLHRMPEFNDRINHPQWLDDALLSISDNPDTAAKFIIAVEDGDHDMLGRIVMDVIEEYCGHGLES